MNRPQERLAQIGVVALAGIAVLGWVREPEKHYIPQAVQRATYQQPDAGGPPVVRELPSEEAVADLNVLPRAGREVVRQRTAPAKTVAPRSDAPEPRVGHQPTTVKVEEPAAVPSRRSEQVDTREPAPQEPELRTRPAEPARDRESETARVEDRQSSRPVVAQDKQRSTKQRAAIIGGAAAAGAVIGAVAGGGKGAAIGAITGGAGGYVYDRMTRRGDQSANTTYRSGPPTPRDADQDNDLPVRSTPLARQFGTPGFAGR